MAKVRYILLPAIIMLIIAAVPVQGNGEFTVFNPVRTGITDAAGTVETKSGGKKSSAVYDSESDAFRTSFEASKDARVIYKFSQPIPAGKYKYARICHKYVNTSTENGGDSINSLFMVTDGRAEFYPRTDVRKISELGGWTTEIFDISKYTREITGVNLVALWGYSGVGNASTDYYVKYIAFFETGQDAEEFDNSLISAKILDSQGTINPVSHTIDLTMKIGITEDMVKQTQPEVSVRSGAKIIECSSSALRLTDFSGREVSYSFNVEYTEISRELLQEMVDFLNALDFADSEKSPQAFFEKYGSLISGLSSDYRNLKEEQREDFYNELLDCKGRYTAENYLTLISDAAFGSSLLNMKPEDYALFIDMLASRNDYAQKDWFVLFSKGIDDKTKQKLLSKALEEATSRRIIEYISQYTLPCAADEAGSWGEFKSLIESYKTLAGLTDEEYKSCCDSVKNIAPAYMRAMEKRPFGSAEELKKAVIYGFAAQKEEEDSSKKNSSPSSGGRPSSGGGRVSITTAVGNRKNDNEQKFPFNDCDNSQYKEAILHLYNKGIVNGYGNGCFNPNASVTRAEFAKMLVLAENINNGSEKVIFSDVSDKAWYSEFVSAAASAGLIYGYGNGEFGVNDYIKREDVAVICERVLNNSDNRGKTVYTDEELASGYAADSIASILEAQVMDCNENARFRPLEHATRAECAGALYRLLQITNK